MICTSNIFKIYIFAYISKISMELYRNISESSNSKKLIIPEKAFSRLPIHRSHADVLLLRAANKCGKAQCFLLWNFQLFPSSRSRSRTWMDFNRTICLWSRKYFQWKIFLVRQQLLQIFEYLKKLLSHQKIFHSKYLRNFLTSDDLRLPAVWRI